MPRKLIVLVDVDDTIADYDWAITNTMRGLYPSDVLLPNLHSDDLPEHVIALRRLIWQKHGWWYTLPLIPQGWLLVQRFIERDARIVFVTKCNLYAANGYEGKAKWIAHYFGEKAELMVISGQRDIVSADVLIDDNANNVAAWLECWPGGVAIIPQHEHNQAYVHPRIVRMRKNDYVDEIVAQALTMRANL